MDFTSYSPYAETDVTSFYLDVWNPRNVPILDDDVMVELPSQFEHRPDLLAYEAYGDSRLWWVFAVRNPSVLKDPIYDLVSGVKIYIPQKQTLLTALSVN